MYTNTNLFNEKINYYIKINPNQKRSDIHVKTLIIIVSLNT